MPRNYAERNLIDFQKSFPDDESCTKHLAEQRWPEGFICPRCGTKEHGTWLKGVCSTVKTAVIKRVSQPVRFFTRHACLCSSGIG